MKERLKKIEEFLKQPNHFFVIVAVILVFSSVIYSFYIYNDAKYSSEESAKTQLKLLALQTTEGISQLFKKYEEDLSFLSSLPNIIDLNEDGKELMRKFFFTQVETISGITRISADGKILYTSPFKQEIIGKDVSYQKHNAQILKTHKPVVSDVFESVQGLTAIVYAYPVLNTKREYTGCISLIIPFKKITERYLRHIKNWNKISVMLINDEGTILYERNEDRIGKNIVNITKDNSLIAFINGLNSKKSMYGNIRSISGDSDGSEYFAFEHRINLPSSHWKLILSIRRDDVYEVVKKLSTKSVANGIAILTGVIVILMIFYISRKEKIDTIKNKEAVYEYVTRETKQIIYDYNLNTFSIKFLGAIKEITGKDIQDFEDNTEDRWWELIHPDDRKKRKDKILEEKEKYKFGKIKYRLRKNGEYIWVEDVYVFNRDSSNQIHQIGLIRDINDEEVNRLISEENRKFLEKHVEDKTKELKETKFKLEEELKIIRANEKELRKIKYKLEEANRLVNELLIKIPDQLRSPMQSVLSFIQLILDEYDNFDKKTICDYLKIIYPAAMKIAITVNKAVYASEYYSNSYTVKYERFMLCHDLIEERKSYFNFSAEMKNIEFSFEKLVHDIEVYTDKEILSIALTEIIENAIKFTDRGFVKISFTKNEEDKIVIIVEDSGSGILPDQMSEIFNPYFQGATGYGRGKKGLGLGLFVAKKYLEKINVDLKIESEKDKGTKAILTFL